ncbi:uncharacterized protein LOC9301210 isoform X2 [Arabidopsis lyrata subsp. lyrata]|uniref:uncharacterized protein LOC9301210 isoform X2 n=1 Tax=Arabidopsis lyrata subsp. lyrata TaxID=81972 RepID=UPI000A29BF0A|nr:uncharacterized protein LOC9301210 isoform X2 [Arabidopsis lyrata subsp. lyrata]|eukprot:XP_020868297.1 uncharacterized protein LOC9301210 isoform X2 [Arabidopsis lyrata subsp. lyrata]
MRSEWVSPSPVTMVVNWLAGKRSNPIHGFERAIDRLNKGLELIEQKEKSCLEKASMEFEMAKQHYGSNNKICALNCIKRKQIMEESARRYVPLRLALLKELMLTEFMKNEFISAERLKKKKKLIEELRLEPTLVFICFWFFLLMLAISISNI